MPNQGAKLKRYLESKNVVKTKLAADLNISPQNLYQYFKSRVLGEETIKRIEKALKVKWKDIESINIETVVTEPKAEAEIPAEDLRSALSKLADAALLGQQNVAEMVQMLKARDEVQGEILRRVIDAGKGLSEAKENQRVMYAMQIAYQNTVLPLLDPSMNATKEFGKKAISTLKKSQKEGLIVPASS